MIKINEYIYQMENLKVGQVYLIADKENTLIDTGMIGDFGKIKKQFNDMNIEIQNIDNIIITHAHMDHTGNLKKLAKHSGAQVYIHSGDYDKVKGKVSSEKLHALNDKDTLDILKGLEVIHVKGHTNGNAALYSKECKVLFSGDCIFNEKDLHFPPNKYNVDTDEFMHNVRRLLDYDVNIVCPGHGQYIGEGGNKFIRDLVSK